MWPELTNASPDASNDNENIKSEIFKLEIDSQDSDFMHDRMDQPSTPFDDIETSTATATDTYSLLASHPSVTDLLSITSFRHL